MSLHTLLNELIEVLSPELKIERIARQALAEADPTDIDITHPVPLEHSVKQELLQPGLHRVCQTIATTPLPWAPPTTDSNPAYVALNQYKVHVELLGPSGLLHSDELRIGVYGLLPHAHYGTRTHPAEEIFVMLAGEAYWQRGDSDYELLQAGQRAYHPSMLPHATKTAERAFMSIYVWRGDVSTDNYTYHGVKHQGSK